MERIEIYKKVEEKAKAFADQYVKNGFSKNDYEGKEEVIKQTKNKIVNNWLKGAEEALNQISLTESEDYSATLNVRLELASNGAIFTDLDCEDKYLGTEVFLNEREEDVAIYEELGGWLYTELEHRGFVGKNIELSIKVKEI